MPRKYYRVANKRQREVARRLGGGKPGTTVVQQTSTTYSGPLPPAEDLARLDEIVPGAARIIVGEFPIQAKHRRQMERLVVISDIIRAQLGLIAGVGVAVDLIYNGTQLLRDGHSLTGFELIGVAIASAAGPFIIRSRIQAKEREAQQQMLPGSQKP